MDSRSLGRLNVLAVCAPLHPHSTPGATRPRGHVPLPDRVLWLRTKVSWPCNDIPGSTSAQVRPPASHEGFASVGQLVSRPSSDDWSSWLFALPLSPFSIIYRAPDCTLACPYPIPSTPPFSHTDTTTLLNTHSYEGELSASQYLLCKLTLMPPDRFWPFCTAEVRLLRRRSVFWVRSRTRYILLLYHCERRLMAALAWHPPLAGVSRPRARCTSSDSDI